MPKAAPILSAGGTSNFSPVLPWLAAIAALTLLTTFSSYEWNTTSMRLSPPCSTAAIRLRNSS
jgi:hypothetical protein